MAYPNTTVAPCKCSHKFQDSIYGKLNRLFNRTKQTEVKNNLYRCSVCEGEKNIGKDTEEEGKKK